MHIIVEGHGRGGIGLFVDRRRSMNREVYGHWGFKQVDRFESGCPVSIRRATNTNSVLISI